MRSISTAAAIAAALVAAAPAAASEQATYSFGLTSEAPSATTGFELRVSYRNADDPDGKAPALTAAAFALPAGMRVDTTRAERCMASDEELQALGRDACPEASRLGDGRLVATTGLPADPIEGEVTVFNGPEQLIELVTAPGTGRTAGFDRLTIEGDRLRARPPATPGGPPDGRTTVREIAFRLAPSPVLATPASCPADGRWRSVGTFGFASGTTLAVPASVPCAAPAPAGSPRSSAPAAGGRFGVRVTLRALHAGRRGRLRVRVLASPQCRRGATVRLGGRRARTGRGGRASLVVRPRSRGRLVIRVGKRGCGSALVRVPVRG